MPMIPIALGEDEREEQIKDDLSVVHGVARNIGHKPVPELGERPRIILLLDKWCDNELFN